MGWGEGPLHTPLCCSYCHEKPPQLPLLLVLVRWHPGRAKRPVFLAGRVRPDTGSQLKEVKPVQMRCSFLGSWTCSHTPLKTLPPRGQQRRCCAHCAPQAHLLSRALWSTLGVEPYQDTVTYQRGNKCKNKKAYEDSANSLRYHFSSDVACNSYS